MNEVKKLVVISRLKSLLSWSSRLGSDETHEIENIIKLLKNG
tara:strand:+ start:8330 stop:8455 length:126 start_codon:yes stop_codon:yes gene_type:complete